MRDVAARFEMDWEMRWWGQGRRVAILVSRHDHCLFDLLWRWRRGELDAEIVAVISNHRSFLPAFAGADPYGRARERGAKLIGATAHYVTEQLDDGPIIDQDVVRVDHRQSARELERVGRDVERLVLARAVSLHLDDRVIVDGKRTIVF